MADGRADEVMPLLQQGLAQLQAGDPAVARATLDKVLAIDPQNFDALNLAGVAATRLKQLDEAVRHLDRAIAVRPDHPGAQVNLGIACRAAGNTDAALRAYRRAVELEPAYAAAQFNLASVLSELSHFEEALAACDRALRLRADHAETLVLRGFVLRRLKRLPEALATIDRAISVSPREPRYHMGRAQILNSLRRHKESLDAYRRAAELSPDDEAMIGPILWPKIKICDWSDREELTERVTVQVLGGKPAITPFTSLLVFEDPALQLAAARNWSQRFTRGTPAVQTTPSARIRLGYFSADFKNHPMMHLMGEVLSRHDRERFHVSGFAFNIGAGDEYTERARSAVDEYIDVDGLSDAEVVELARGRGIDIAVDRKGYTSGARTGILARRAAPVQVNYLAYPGTMGADFIDYIVADRTIVPADAAQHYAEKIVWMPDSYAPRDTRVEVPPSQGRQEAGLPEDAFVFCSFNQSSKITPEFFASWMGILARVPNGVLWLLEDNAAALDNLRRHASAHGIDPSRLVFAPKRPQLEHLARICLADLCLDTLPYNAHTTANDALYVGVPILTLPGETFASRVCASLLNAVGLPELIVPDAASYVEEAIAIANDPVRLAALRTRLADARRTAPLYDMNRYVSALEAAFIAMHERRLRGLPPDHIAVGV